MLRGEPWAVGKNDLEEARLDGMKHGRRYKLECQAGGFTTKAGTGACDSCIGFTGQLLFLELLTFYKIPVLRHSIRDSYLENLDQGSDFTIQGLQGETIDVELKSLRALDGNLRPLEGYSALIAFHQYLQAAVGGNFDVLVFLGFTVDGRRAKWLGWVTLEELKVRDGYPEERRLPRLRGQDGKIKALKIPFEHLRPMEELMTRLVAPTCQAEAETQKVP